MNPFAATAMETSLARKCCTLRCPWLSPHASADVLGRRNHDCVQIPRCNLRPNVRELRSRACIHRCTSQVDLRGSATHKLSALRRSGVDESVSESVYIVHSNRSTTPYRANRRCEGEQLGGLATASENLVVRCSCALDPSTEAKGACAMLTVMKDAPISFTCG